MTTIQTEEETVKKDASRTMYNVLFWATVAILILARFYKAHNTGIIHDEHWTLRDFCTDFHTALTNYSSTNNHILNSISIIITRSLFGSYDHFVRIHSCLWSAVFCLSAGWLIMNIVKSRILQYLLMLTVLTNWFIFDLSYLARGYSMSLGICTFTLAVYSHIIEKNNLAMFSQWKILALQIVMNFISIGSMLSSVNIVFAINIAYAAAILVLWRRKDLKIKEAGVKIGILISGSALSLLMLYGSVLSKLRQATVDFKEEPLLAYAQKTLWAPFIKLSFIDRELYKSCELWLTIVLCFIGVCLAAVIITKLISLAKRNEVALSPATMLTTVFIITIAVKIIQYKAMGISLGMPRNSVFTLMLIILLGGIIIDSAMGLANRNIVARLLFAAVTICVIMPFIYINNLPSLNAVDVRPFDWGKQSAVGPLARKLKRIDDSRLWNVRLDGYADCLGGPISYYKNFGYKINRTKGNDFDLLIVREHEQNKKYRYFEYDYFTDFHCCVITKEEIK